jgi:pimeloyl-ACP methyl ester carboxylesterase
VESALRLSRVHAQRAPRIRRAVISLDNNGLNVGVAVAGRGVPFVFLHGIGLDNRTYYQCFRRLARLGFLVIGIDAPGHGATRSIGRAASFTERAEVIDRAMVYLGIEKCVLGGHSMGGRSTACLTASRPERTLAAVFVDAALGHDWDVTAQQNANDRRALVRESRAAMLDAGRDVRAVGLTGGRGVIRSYSSALRSVSGGVGNFAATARAVAVPESVRWLSAAAAAGVPSVVVHGALDMVVDVSSGRAAAEVLGAPFYVSQTAHHSWLLASPYSFGVLMQQLLTTEIARHLSGLAPGDCVRGDSPLVDLTAGMDELGYRPVTDRGAPPFGFIREEGGQE